MSRKPSAPPPSRNHAENPPAISTGEPFRRISVVDVAHRAGVSTATVSRVLNGTTGVKPNKEEAVRRACEELGYVLNGAARALSSNRTKTIGAVVPTLSNQTFSRLLSAFQSRLHAHGYTLLLANSEFDPATELEGVINFLEHGVDALLVTGHTHDPKMWQRIERSRIPCIQALSLDKNHPSIGFDNVAIGREMVDHLVALGHTRIGMLVGVPPTNDRVSNRILGVRRRLAKNKLTLAEHHVKRTIFTLEEARAAMLNLLDLPDAPTAIICGNDGLAFGALLAANQSGRKVPEDLSIIGFNNYDFAAHLTPPLTTVNVDLEQLGEHAARYLLGQLGAVPPQTIPRINAEFLPRASTGPVPRQPRPAIPAPQTAKTQ